MRCQCNSCKSIAWFCSVYWTLNEGELFMYIGRIAPKKNLEKWPLLLCWISIRPWWTLELLTELTDPASELEIWTLCSFPVLWHTMDNHWKSAKVHEITILTLLLVITICSHVYVMVLVLTMGLIICVENLTSASKYYKSSDWKQPEASEKAWPGRLLCHSSAATPDIGIYYLCQKLSAMKCAML